MRISDEYWVCIELHDGGWYTNSTHRTYAAALRGVRIAKRREHGAGSSIYVRKITTLGKRHKT